MTDPLPPWARLRPTGLEVQVKVVPRSSRQGIAGQLGDRLKILLHAPPAGGEANRALIQVMAEAAGVAAGRIRITAGETGRSKTVLVATEEPDAALRSVLRATSRGR